MMKNTNPKGSHCFELSTDYLRNRCLYVLSPPGIPKVANVGSGYR